MNGSSTARGTLALNSHIREKDTAPRHIMGSGFFLFVKITEAESDAAREYSLGYSAETENASASSSITCIYRSSSLVRILLKTASASRIMAL